MQDLSGLEKNLGVTFVDKNLLLQAVVHRSYLNEHPTFAVGHNERLEFLGDAVIELVVTEYLYEHYPNPEGELTTWRSALVNAITLSDICKQLGVEDYMHLSRGESKDIASKARMYILANAFEAVVGSMYLDRGYDVCKTFIGEKVISRLPYILEHHLYLDPKSRFQEAAQERQGMTPQYKVLDEVGPDHAKIFTVGVCISSEQIAVGQGTSKQEAQVAAAEKA
nr:ribonuclease III [Patescibacteria group bacterium]